MREQHRRYCPVGMTDEYRPSKTCLFCLQQQVRPARSRRIKDGRITVVNVHGALEGVNPDYLSFKCGYTVKPWDEHAAVAIALAGIYLLTDSQRQTLPPLAREMRPQDNALVATINTSSSLGSTSSPPDIDQDPNRAPYRDRAYR